MAYNQETKEKQAFEEAMKNADDFFAKGLLKMQSKTNIQENITEYKKIARTAYSNKRHAEASEYFEKVLELNGKDHEAIFLSSLCKGLEKTPNDDLVDKLYEAYKTAIANISVEEDMDGIIEAYSVKFADFVVEWFRNSQKECNRNLADWYNHNKHKFYNHAGRAKKAVDIMDCLMPIILKSDLDNDVKVYPYAFWYCSMCRDYCSATMYYKINDRDKAITSSKYAGPLGYSAEEKKEYVQKYDDMCFEIRKFRSDFEKLEDSWSYGFPRMSPPDSYEEQQQNNRVERMMQLQKEAEISKAVAEWRAAGGAGIALREKKIRKYMSGNLKDRKIYYNHKKQMNELETMMNSLILSVYDKNKMIETKNEEITLLKAENFKKREIIGKLSKRIFGKAKAKEGIEVFNKEIQENENCIILTRDEISQLEKEISETKQQISEIVAKKDAQQREMDMFLNKCII